MLLVAGFALLGTIDHQTPLVLVGIYMAMVGLGVGMSMQNLVLAVQNPVDVADIGAASATVSFFRSLGGAIGVSVLGAVLSTHVADLVTSGLAQIGITTSGSGGRQHQPRRQLAPSTGRRLHQGDPPANHRKEAPRDRRRPRAGTRTGSTAVASRPSKAHAHWNHRISSLDAAQTVASVSISR